MGRTAKKVSTSPKPPTVSVDEVITSPSTPTPIVTKSTTPLTGKKVGEGEEEISLKGPLPDLAFLPLHHYLSILPLQLMTIYFTILFSPSPSTASLFPVSSSATSSIPAISPTFFASSKTIENLSNQTFSLALKSLIYDPKMSLIRFNLGLLLIMSWFGIKMRGFRRNALGLNKKEGGGEKREKVGFMGTLKKMSGEAVEGKKPELGKGGPPMAYYLPAVGLTLIGSLILHFVCITLGAPPFTSIPETYLLSLMVSLLSLLPLFLSIPFDTDLEVYKRLALFEFKNELEFALVAPALGAIVGCWLGAIAIPLDWDRDWQKWPTTTVIGSIIGHTMGSIVALIAISLKSIFGPKISSVHQHQKRD